MGIRGLQTFIEEKLCLLHEIQLNNCNVVFDGNSIYHQMYKECNLTCLFGGEYDKFYRYCKQLFESFRLCRINVIVVFDGARIDNRKLSTALQRARKRVDYSTATSVNIDLSPLHLRQTFVDVLDEMNIPYISAIGECDDECVSLANHLDCYLMSRDSDYYCYNLIKGYVPFDYVDVNPVQTDSYCYLSAQLFISEFLFERFSGLNHSTLSLACSLCGNDYIDRNSIESIQNYVTETVNKSHNRKTSKKNQTIHWYLMHYMKNFDNAESAMQKLFVCIKKQPKHEDIEKSIRLSVESYLNPSDTLIYRFASPNNTNLQKNQYFIQLARDYFDKLDLTDENIHSHIENDILSVKSKNNNRIPSCLLDKLTDLRINAAFIEILVHRRIICSSHIEIESEPSIHSEAFPIIFPCFAILINSDNETNEQLVTIYHRALKQLKACTYSIENYGDIFNLDNMHLLSLNEREHFICKCLHISYSYKSQYEDIHSDYHFWLIIIHCWYRIRQLKPVYIYGIILTLIKSIYLTKNPTDQHEIISLLSISIDDERNSPSIEPNVWSEICRKIKQLTKNLYDKKRFDCSIIHELNCLQAIYLYATQANQFLDCPYKDRIRPDKFLCGSFFYAFVEIYETKRNVSAAVESLLNENAQLIKAVDRLYIAVTSDIDN